MGIFLPVVRENVEMLYQFEHDYRIDSSKAERTFGLTAAAYREGVAAALDAPIKIESMLGDLLRR